MKTFELRWNYSRLFFPIVLVLLFYRNLFAFSIKIGASSILLWLLLVALVINNLICVFKKERISMDDESTTIAEDFLCFRNKKIYFQHIKRITFLEKRFVLYTDRMFRKNFEYNRFKNNDWDEILSVLKNLPQATIQ